MPGVVDVEKRRRLAVRILVPFGGFLLLLTLFMSGSPSCRGIGRDENVPLVEFPYKIEQAPQVRMLVRRKAASVALRINGFYTIYDHRGNEVSNRDSRKLSTVHVTFNGRHLSLGRVPVVINGENLTRIRIKPHELGSLVVNHKVYPGEVEFIGVPGRRAVHCVVRLNIEEYICGVLAGEVPVDKWHDEALRAQAVASRTYALFYVLKNRRKLWHFGASGRESQEYKTGIVRNARINRAVNSTRGQVLTWQNQVFPAYFHSSCGGHTLDSASVFTSVSIKPLSGAKCKWCTDPKLKNKYATWKKSFSIDTIARRLATAARSNPNLRKLRNKGGVRALEIAETSPDGRITRFRVRVNLAPFSHDVWANDVRLALGASEVRSTKCTLKTNSKGTYYRFAGTGWGHGVGLCQYGSLGMARAGHDYREILDHYFPYSRLIRMSYDRPENAPVAGGAKLPAAPSRKPPPPPPPRKSRSPRQPRPLRPPRRLDDGRAKG